MAHNRKTLIGIGLEDAASWKLTAGGLKTVGDKAVRRGPFATDFAAGLKESLIKALRPLWNQLAKDK